MSHDQWFAVLLVLCSGYAVLFGGAPERIAGTACVVASLASIAVAQPLVVRYDHVERGILLVDAAMSLGFLAIALRSRRFWPLWATGLLGVQLLSHLIGLSNLHVLNLTYALINRSIGYFILPLIAVATLRHRRRLRRYGADASWLPF